MVRHFRIVKDLDVPPRLHTIHFGSLISNPSAPHQGYFDLTAVTGANGKKPTVDGDELAHVKEVLGSLKEGKLRALLTHFVSASFGHKSQSQSQFATRQLKEYRVDNSDAWFTDVCAVPEGRVWMETALKLGRPIYMVVGCRTVADATFTHVDASVTTAAAQGGDPQSGVGAGASGTFAHGFRRGYAAPDERVFAIQVRQVAFDFFGTKDVDAAFLESKNHWKQIAKFLGAVDEDQEIGAALTDDVEYEDAREDEEAASEKGTDGAAEGAAENAEEETAEAVGEDEGEGNGRDVLDDGDDRYTF